MVPRGMLSNAIVLIVAKLACTPLGRIPWGKLVRSGDPQTNRLDSAGCEAGHEPWTLCTSFDFPVGIPNHTVAIRCMPVEPC